MRLYVSLLLGVVFANQPIVSTLSIHHPLRADNGMVVAQEKIAANVGLEILKKGGNAVDAAVATAFALAVTLPRAGNIGGGGFMLVYNAKLKKSVAIDYREKAPSLAHRDMYLDKDGNVIEGLSSYHGLAVGVPGTVAGLLHALEKYGTMKRGQVLAPAIRLAKKGFIVPVGMSDSLKAVESKLQWDSTKKVFFKKDGTLYKNGDLFKQPDLARTLERIAERGTKGFYEGKTAKDIVSTVKKAGGSMTLEDLKNYNVVEREPVSGLYRGYKIVSMPPPSSGGVHIIEILNILENFDLASMGHNSAKAIAHMVEAMKLAYADRSEYLGDPDFVKVPVKELTSKEYGSRLAKGIDYLHPKEASKIRPNLPREGNETTHFSIVDKHGNVVSNTYTLNFSYGTGLVADGSGFLLNNEMDDFSSKSGVPNAYGLIGNDANAIEAHKRPLSSMSPTIVFKDDRPILVTGSPGGSRIITTVLQIILNVIDHKMNIAEATHALRIHNQWLPDEIRIEKGLNDDTISILESLGYTVKVRDAMGSSQSIMILDDLEGSSDPRIQGAAAIGY